MEGVPMVISIQSQTFIFWCSQYSYKNCVLCHLFNILDPPKISQFGHICFLLTSTWNTAFPPPLCVLSSTETKTKSPSGSLWKERFFTGWDFLMHLATVVCSYGKASWILQCLDLQKPAIRVESSFCRCFSFPVSLPWGVLSPHLLYALCSFIIR